MLNFETETDVLFHLPAREPDNPNYRLWEAAGTAHVDGNDLTLIGYQEHSQTPQAVDPSCTFTVNTAPEIYLFDTAYADLRAWVSWGRPPPKAPRMQINAAGTDVARDAFGNGIGGIRLPQLEAPTATLTGTGNRPANSNPVSLFCVLFGTTTPLDTATLSALYPTHAAYVQKFTEQIAAAYNSKYGWPVTVTPEKVNWSSEWKKKSRNRVLSAPKTAHYIAGWPRDTDLGVIAEVDGERIGAAWLRFLPAADPGYGFVAPDVPELTIGVAVHWRGRGAGRALLRAIADQACSAGTRRISLSVERKNVAWKLYISEGYQIVDSSDKDSDTMVKDLAASRVQS